MYTPEQVKALVKLGFTPEQITLLAGEGIAPVAQAAVAAPPKAEVPAFIVQFAINRQARRALAAEMRANGQDPSDAKAWAKAKKAAKIA